MVSCDSSHCYGSLSVSVFDSANERTIQPQMKEIRINSYRLYGINNTIECEGVDTKFVNNYIKIDGLATGMWEFTVEGYNSDGVLIATSEPQTVNIELNNVTDVEYSLDWLDGKGVLSLSISEQSSRVEIIECTLIDAGNKENIETLIMKSPVLDNGLYRFEKIFDLKTGFYNASIVMKDEDGKQIGVALHPSVHIYKGLTSAYEFSWKDLPNLFQVDPPTAESSFSCTNTSDYLVDIHTAEEGTTIFYSFDNESYTQYEVPIDVTSLIAPTNSVIIYAYAKKDGMKTSEISEIVCRREHKSVNYKCTDCEMWTNGPSGGFVFYDCDADNTEEDPDGPDNLISTECGWRYLEAAPQDYNYDRDDSSNYYRFGYYRVNSVNKLIGTKTAIGAGKENTANLVKAMKRSAYIQDSHSEWVITDQYAARLCDIYSIDVDGITFDDWFLPSKDELALLYTNLKMNSLSLWKNAVYWSSSEENANYAYSQSFNDGESGESWRENIRYVRPIRAFL